MKIQIESVHFDADVKLTDFIQSKLDKLEVFFDRIIDGRVVLRLEQNGQVQDKIAELILRVPGELLVSKANQKSFEAAVDGATESMRRQLIRYKERIRASH
ncbi:MAG TPA: ribosome-associated translation inhibitor RaiA [Saprospiraceae bacterium]|nr:ribosome-associated translation inhibitor RaiA [Saprospiraceae bacterium]MCB9269783.1 ribosome-associated translation inhibitor RaiA [Lewinellaceae bacterium]MCB0674301.1 ribosome-associated translation inhibitor RaiA [Saprospiraceae bacterium]MCB9321233.1 ribosome-associated translation inhibitor RaiA [Lewinellaceae bacterium]HPG06667.1 ribosome-associated translation inhibitor RaiA [Saprospiraceae bacterium]